MVWLKKTYGLVEVKHRFGRRKPMVWQKHGTEMKKQGIFEVRKQIYIHDVSIYA